MRSSIKLCFKGKKPEILKTFITNQYNLFSIFDFLNNKNNSFPTKWDFSKYIIRYFK